MRKNGPSWKDLYIEIGSLVRELRRKRNLTQEQLASQAGLRRTSITNIEAGRQRIPVDLLFDLAEGLHVSASDLLPDGAAGIPKDIEDKIPANYAQAERSALRRIVR